VVDDTPMGDLQEMRPALESRFSRAAPRPKSFEVVKSRVTVLTRIAELVGRAEVEVTLAIPHRLVDEVAAELRDAVDRGVLVVLIATDVGPSAAGAPSSSTSSDAGRTVAERVATSASAGGRPPTGAPFGCFQTTSSRVQDGAWVDIRASTTSHYTWHQRS
jgi:hypothetical protein